ncbi:hypothetical protein [Streptomyces sp. NPDC002545]
MGEQPNVSTANCEGGSWQLRVRHEGETTIAEVWSFGVKLSVTTLNTNGDLTVQEA